MNAAANTRGSRPRIALFGLGLNSFTNPSVESALRRAFREYEIDWFDLAPIVMARPFMRARLLGHSGIEFGSRVSWNPWKLKRQRLWTTFLFSERSRAAREIVRNGRYVFSMQIQSTYDAGGTSVPHFVYTDNALLADLQYEHTERGDLPVTSAWLEQERRLYRNAASCFVMSRNVGRSLVQDYGCAEDRVICAYGGRNVPDSPDMATASLDRNGNILFVGVDWERKGGPELIEAFRLVRQRVPGATLTIVGCSPNVGEPGCRVVGRVPRDRVGEHYAAASIFCMPTRHEPFGIAFVEAMARQLPIVATDVGAIPDFVSHGENGFCVPPGDVRGLADALVTLLTNAALRKQMGERSKAAAENYTWDNTAAIMRRSIEPKLGAMN